MCDTTISRCVCCDQVMDTPFMRILYQELGKRLTPASFIICIITVSEDFCLPTNSLSGFETRDAVTYVHTWLTLCHVHMQLQ